MTTSSTRRSLAASASSAFWLGFEAALGVGFELVGGDADRGQIFLGRVRAAVTEAEIVFGGAAPVAVTLEQEALAGILREVVFRGLELRALGGLDVGFVEVEIDRLQQTADRVSVVDHAVARRCGSSAESALGEQHLSGIDVIAAGGRSEQRRLGSGRIGFLEQPAKTSAALARTRQSFFETCVHGSGRE